MKKIISMILVVALTATLSVAGTLAYLQDDDSAVNVMTLGNVQIEQIEQERDANGKLVDFTQAKPAFPAVGSIEWADDGVDVNGTAYKVFADGLKNVVDKIVTVKNTGVSPAYVRTVIAIEAPGFDPDGLIHININNDGVSYSDWINVEIDGVDYCCVVATYEEALKPGEISAPSLVQVFLDSKATNEDCAKLGDTWEIRVLSQAVQTAGFESAATAQSAESSAPAAALNTAFGEATKENVIQWFSGMQAPVVVNTLAELKAAGRNGGKFVLGADIHITDKSEFFYGSYVTAIYNDMILDLNGHSITVDVDMGTVSGAPILFYVYAEGASLTVVGDGDVIAKHDAFLVFPRSVSEGAYIYGGNWYNVDETSGTKNDINAIVYSQTNNNIHIYGGTFTFKNVNGHCGAFNVYDNSGAQIVLHEGVLLSNSNYYKGSDADEIHLADGCTLKEVVIDGETWYQVVK